MTTTESVTRDKQSVIDTIQSEHRSLGQVLELLQHLLGSIAAQHAVPDFELLCVCLHYMKDFPGRCHHPKEDRYLFKAIRKHAPAHVMLLNQLEAEHVLDTQMLRDLHSALVSYQAGAANGLQHLRAHLDIYVAMLHEHTRKEETLLSALEDEIPACEWQAIADAFSTDGDPLFGKTQQRELDLLRDRIKSRLPAKLRYAARGESS